jgi:hypothetical protein
LSVSLSNEALKNPLAWWGSGSEKLVFLDYGQPLPPRIRVVIVMIVVIDQEEADARKAPPKAAVRSVIEESSLDIPCPLAAPQRRAQPLKLDPKITERPARVNRKMRRRRFSTAQMLNKSSKSVECPRRTAAKWDTIRAALGPIRAAGI